MQKLLSCMKTDFPPVCSYVYLYTHRSCNHLILHTNITVYTKALISSKTSTTPRMKPFSYFITVLFNVFLLNVSYFFFDDLSEHTCTQSFHSIVLQSISTAYISLAEQPHPLTHSLTHSITLTHTRTIRLRHIIPYSIQ